MMKIFFYVIWMVPIICLYPSMVSMQLSYMVILLLMIYSMNCLEFFGFISYNLGLDIYSYCLICLSFMIGSLMLISMVDCYSIKFFNFMNFLLTISLLINFSSMNFLYMYISFEFVLVPLMILILGWGYQPERLMSGMYLFFYTAFASLPLLMLILYLNYSYNSLFFDYLVSDSKTFLIHFILVLVFMVKFPMYLLHYWLPKAHVQAPVSGSMILAGLMLKIGGYGLIRVMMIYEYLFIKYSYIWFTFSIVGSFLVALICLVQGDMKCLIAYSSVSHMGMVIMGMMTMKVWGLLGSYMLMLGHGFCSSGLFYMANMLYNRTMSRSFYLNSGLMVYIPSGSLIWFLLCTFNMSCPPSLNFISEFMILISVISFWSYSFFLFMLISFTCACFSYYMYSYSFHGVYHSLYSFSSVTVMEYLCVINHLIPLIFIPIFIMDLF
uniref:NADH dehydrogenase subunit 4 n=1 Tax=Nesophrosyne sp. 302 GMB-2012 TaxID=1223987 RepID=UPI0021821A2D|nr:NADH dehydrogenase subunit 4 [Nesophrosyne sp. 302 GMB-2012]UVI59664.1 NADH dehydrogenase subunit 4 [Nesophrosyne sp. 302 GMB-2012]